MTDFDRIYERCLTQDCPPSEEAEERVNNCHERIKKNKVGDDCRKCWRAALKGIVEYL